MDAVIGDASGGIVVGVGIILAAFTSLLAIVGYLYRQERQAQAQAQARILHAKDAQIADLLTRVQLVEGRTERLSERYATILETTVKANTESLVALTSLLREQHQNLMVQLMNVLEAVDRYSQRAHLPP